LNGKCASYQARKQGSEESLVSVLRASVSAGEYGPLITLSGEADVTTAAELGELMTVQLDGGTWHLAPGTWRSTLPGWPSLTRRRSTCC
jgi:uncharacterized cupin superfamily protein